MGTAFQFLTVFLKKCGSKQEDVDYRPLFENFLQVHSLLIFVWLFCLRLPVLSFFFLRLPVLSLVLSTFDSPAGSADQCLEP